MSSFFSNKAVQLLLSISVSIWMAGGCLLGCSNTSMAAETADGSGHDCCASQKKQSTRKVKQPEGVTSFAPTPRGMMNDCPLVTNATAAISKNTTNVPDPGRTSAATLPQLEKQTQMPNNALVVPVLPNRGPTHLLCCVFLI
jgi:hypothetical protein